MARVRVTDKKRPLTRGYRAAEAKRVAEARAQWLEMFVQGATLRQIAKHAGKSIATIHEAVHAELAKIPKTQADAARAMCEEQLKHLYAAAIIGSRDPKLDEVERSKLRTEARKCNESYRRMLGLDSKQVVSIETDDTLAKLFASAMKPERDGDADV